MSLLYADESGTSGGSHQKHFILSGIIVFERNAHWLSLELEKLASRFSSHNPGSVELHAVSY